MNPSDLTQLEIEQLWDLWFEAQNQLVKDELVIRFIPLVEQVAGRLRMGLPNFVNMDELVNSGVIGLISAIENYDRDRANKFETYAVTRIRGSVLDGLRDYDWMPRSIRAKTKLLENTLVTLEVKLGRIPHDHEVASFLELEMNEYYQLLDDVHIASILSLDDPIFTGEGESGTLSDMVEDEDAESPESQIEWEDTKRVAKKLVKSLNQQDRLVIALYYYENLTLREIGEVLEISESRVSQIHSKIILTLKGKLRELLYPANKK